MKRAILASGLMAALVLVVTLGGTSAADRAHERAASGQATLRSRTSAAPAPAAEVAPGGGGVVRVGTRATPSAPGRGSCEEFVTAGGYIVGTPGGGHGNLTCAGGIRRGELWGHFNYVDHDTGLHAHGTSITEYTCLSEFCRRIRGTIRVRGDEGTFTVIACDLGEPGRDDTYTLDLSYGPGPTLYHGEGDLDAGGGNIQLHFPCLVCGGEETVEEL